MTAFPGAPREALDSGVAFPASRCYVLKVHRDCRPGRDRWLGRLEHIASGDCTQFESREELLAWIGDHVDGLGNRPVDD